MDARPTLHRHVPAEMSLKCGRLQLENTPMTGSTVPERGTEKTGGWGGLLWGWGGGAGANLQHREQDVCVVLQHTSAVGRRFRGQEVPARNNGVLEHTVYSQG
jgi:hypothetical protein